LLRESKVDELPLKGLLFSCAQHRLLLAIAQRAQHPAKHAAISVDEGAAISVACNRMQTLPIEEHQRSSLEYHVHINAQDM
jgi:hypothetical protein